MELEYYYILIPIGLFLLSFVLRFFLTPAGFLDILNVGRELCLESLSIGAIAYLHMKIDKLKCDTVSKILGETVSKSMKLKEIMISIKIGPDTLLIILGFIFAFYTI